MEEGVDSDGTAMGGGGTVLSDGEIATIIKQTDQDIKDDFNNQTLLARIFDIDLAGSFAQRFVSRLPTSFHSLARLPLSTFGLVLSGNNVSAESTDISKINPFGLPLYGYAANDPALTADPFIYTDEYCAQTAKARSDSYEKRDGELVATYHISDPCALDKMVGGAALNAAGVTDDKYSLSSAR
jgi:hypothetical protein